MKRYINHWRFSTNKPISLYDKWLMTSLFGLVLIGLMMVASSSIMVSSQWFGHPFHFLIRQVIYLFFGVLISIVILRTEIKVWERYSVLMLFICIFLMLLVLVPGIGKVVNGSRRWLSLGPIGIQVSELAKLTIILYLAGYIVRQKDQMHRNILGFLKPLVVLALFAALLLLEPDFGATVVIAGTVMVMLFLSGVRLQYYGLMALLIAGVLVFFAISAPYRMARLTSFLNPWADQFKSGYQLTQSLIAFGRGGGFGVGLGESIQKLFYLPESHTDFLFAVLAEELGLTGILLVLFLYSILIIRGLCIGYKAYLEQHEFAAYLAYGITCWIGLQATINMGVSTGLLPTKGLTLPLLSYGGASLVVNCIGIALLLRIDHENRWQALGF